MSQLRLLSLLVTGALAACGGAAAPSPTPTPPAPSHQADAPVELTTADEVLEAYLVATGGREARERVTASHTTGTVEILGAGVSGTMETFMAAPREVRSTMALAGLGAFDTGCTQDVCWSLDAMTGPRLLSGDELAQTLRMSTFNADLHYAALYTRVELAGIIERDGRRTYELHFTTPQGKVDKGYYDVETLLSVGGATHSTSPMGDMVVETWSKLDSYRSFAGIRQPTVLTQDLPGAKIVIRIDDISYGPVPPETFAMPADVAALAAP